MANSVKEQLSFLIDLQTLDSRIGQLKDRKLGVPQAIEETKQRLETFKSQWTAVKNEAETIQKTRREKEPSRTKEEEEAQGAPAITNRAQVRRLRLASVRMERNRNFGDACAV